MAQQTINLGSAPDDGTGDTLRVGGDKINDNFDELYDETLKFKGSTDCSANPNYPAALKADSYRVSAAGKIGGASGVDVEIGDLFYAIADNAGGTQAAVGTSWGVLQANAAAAGGIDVEDEGVSETVGATTLNFVGAGVTAADAGGGQVDITIPGGVGIDIEDEGVSEATGATTLNFVGAGVVAADMGGGVVDITIAGGGSGIDVEDEGVSEATGVSILNFTGAGVTATDAGGGQVDVAIPGSGAWTLIESLTPSAVASINSEAWAGGSYKVLKFFFRLTVSDDSTALTVRFKLNTAYKTAANYRWSCDAVSSGAAEALGGAQTATALTIGHSGANGIGNNTLEHIAGEITIHRPFETTKPKALTYHVEGGAPSGSWQSIPGGGTFDGTDAANALEGLQFLISAGTFTGTIDVIGLN